MIASAPDARADAGSLRGDAPPPPETIETSEHRVACDGGGGALGHPRVFLEMGDEPFVDCPYCGRRFVLRDAAAR